MLSFSKFSFTEMFSNSCGKTSASIVCGVLLIATGCFMGLAGGYQKQSEAMIHGLAFATLGTGLLGIRRFSPDKNVSQTANQTTP